MDEAPCAPRSEASRSRLASTTPREVAALFRYLRTVTNTVNVVNTMTFTAELFATIGNADATAVIAGLLDDRSFQAASLSRLEHTITQLEASLGDRWEVLTGHGKAMTMDDLIDYTLTHLTAIH